MGDAENPFPQEVGTMKGKLYWLAIKKTMSIGSPRIERSHGRTLCAMEWNMSLIASW